MDIDKIEIGQQVKVWDTGEVGTVDSIDYDDSMAYVRFAVTGGTDVVDIDPGDLREA